MSIENYLEIQKRLKLRGENLSQLAHKFKTERSGIRKAFIGKWDGPKAKKIVRSICLYVGLQPPASSIENNKKNDIIAPSMES